MPVPTPPSASSMDSAARFQQAENRLSGPPAPSQVNPSPSNQFATRTDGQPNPTNPYPTNPQDAEQLYKQNRSRNYLQSMQPPAPVNVPAPTSYNNVPLNAPTQMHDNYMNQLKSDTTDFNDWYGQLTPQQKVQFHPTTPGGSLGPRSADELEGAIKTNAKAHWQQMMDLQAQGVPAPSNPGQSTSAPPPPPTGGVPAPSGMQNASQSLMNVSGPPLPTPASASLLNQSGPPLPSQVPPPGGSVPPPPQGMPQNPQQQSGENVPLPPISQYQAPHQQFVDRQNDLASAQGAGLSSDQYDQRAQNRQDQQNYQQAQIENGPAGVARIKAGGASDVEDKKVAGASDLADKNNKTKTDIANINAGAKLDANRYSTDAKYKAAYDRNAVLKQIATERNLSQQEIAEGNANAKILSSGYSTKEDKAAARQSKGASVQTTQGAKEDATAPAPDGNPDISANSDGTFSHKDHPGVKYKWDGTQYTRVK